MNKLSSDERSIICRMHILKLERIANEMSTICRTHKDPIKVHRLLKLCVSDMQFRLNDLEERLW